MNSQQSPRYWMWGGIAILAVLVLVAATKLRQSGSYNKSGAYGYIDPSLHSLFVSLDSAATPVSAILAGNQTKTVAAFKFTSVNDANTISEIAFSIPNATTVRAVILKDGDKILATQPYMASSTFAGLNIVVPANSSKRLLVDVQLGFVGSGAGTSGERVQVTLRSFKSFSSSAGATSTTAANVTANDMYVYKAVPTIYQGILPTNVLKMGTNIISQFSIGSGSAGDIAWQHLVFSYSVSSQAIILSNPQLFDAAAPNAAIVAISNVDIANHKIIFNTTYEQVVGGSSNKDYILRVTVSGPPLVTGDYVTTRIANPTAVWSRPTIAARAAYGASFTWSDISALNHSLITADWNKDFLVKNLPTDSQTLVK